MCEDLELIKSAEEKIVFGENLLKSLENFEGINGVTKLFRKINQELKFLKKVIKNESVKKEHLQCTNLTHFSALIEVLSKVKDCTSINQVFIVNDRKITVDIVCDGGLTWIKVVARNPKSLTQISLGDASYGVRSILDQGVDFISCSQLNPCLYKIPKVIFYFANGIESDLAKKLKATGINVQCSETKPLVRDYQTSDEPDSAKIDILNLDVSAMIAYVSSLTNGNCKYKFSVPVLTQQAEWEVHRPVKPVLDELFKDKKLYCCETARDNFNSIVATVGGDAERIRAQELMQRLTVLPDDATSDDIKKLENCQSPIPPDLDRNSNCPKKKLVAIGGKIKERSRIIFRFGDRIKAITVTANDGFVRSAKQQGIHFVVFIHESRALTEQKEAIAQPLE